MTQIESFLLHNRVMERDLHNRYIAEARRVVNRWGVHRGSENSSPTSWATLSISDWNISGSAVTLGRVQPSMSQAAAFNELRTPPCLRYGYLFNRAPKAINKTLCFLLLLLRVFCLELFYKLLQQDTNLKQVSVKIFRPISHLEFHTFLHNFTNRPSENFFWQFTFISSFCSL